MTTKFWSMVGKGVSKKKLALGRAKEGFDDLKLWELIETLNSPEQWNVLQLSLDEGELVDIQPTDILGRVCSPKLAEIFQSFNAEMMCLPVHLKRADVEYIYYYLHFPTIPDVLDKRKSIYAGSRLFRPHFSLEKAAPLPAFIVRHLGCIVYVRDDVRKAIIKAKCVGVEFEKAEAS
jgi:hypothetical protein